MESVLRQTWREIEYLVIDGGSTDGTVDVIREYEAKFGGRMRWVSERDRGMYDAINKGIRASVTAVKALTNPFPCAKFNILLYMLGKVEETG
jgi:glycosyltransferase involved in cell wall biosynthesis